MTPIEVLPLQSAKDYLRVDYNDDDALITDCIYAAIDIFERKTQYRLYNRTELIEVGEGITELFQTPLRSYSIMDFYTSEAVTNFSATKYPVRTTIKFHESYCYTSSAPVMIISADVGFTSVDQLPQGAVMWLKRCVVWLYENRNINEISEALDNDLNVYRRFVMW